MTPRIRAGAKPRETDPNVIASNPGDIAGRYSRTMAARRYLGLRARTAAGYAAAACALFLTEASVTIPGTLAEFGDRLSLASTAEIELAPTTRPSASTMRRRVAGMRVSSRSARHVAAAVVLPSTRAPHPPWRPGIRSHSRAAITVGPNVHVSVMRDSLVHDEVMIGAHAEDSAKLIACSIAHTLGKRELVTIAYTTMDGGATWQPTVTDTGPGSADPVCMYGPADEAYFIAIAFRGDPAFLNVHRSEDGGRTWLDPTKVPRIPDRPAMAVDRTNGDYHGRIYIGYNAYRGVLGIDPPLRRSAFGLIHSSNGGATFTYPVMRMLNEESPMGWPLDMEVLSDGTLVIVYRHWIDNAPSPTYRRGVLKAMTSTDGGESIAPAVLIDSLWSREPSRTTFDVTSTAVDATEGPFKDRIYAVWSDVRSGRSEIYIVFSSEKGETWSKPRVINDDRPWPMTEKKYQGPNHVMPQVAVNKNGIVGVMWYDRREVLNDAGYNVRFSASSDGGETWLSSVRISEKPKGSDVNERWAFDPGVISDSTKEEWPISVYIRRSKWVTGGHTAGLAPRADGVFFPLWVDDRTGHHQVWAAPVTVRGTAARNGSPELAALSDITGRTTLDLTYVTHDRAEGILTANARLKNTGTDTLHGTVKVRAISLTSPIGVIAIANADNDKSGPGAVWDFTGTLPAGGLPPDSTTCEKSLVFHLTDVRPAMPARDVFEFGVLDMDVRVLGEAPDERVWRSAAPHALEAATC